MEKDYSFSDIQISRALYGFYSPDSDEETTEESSKTLQNLPKNKKTIVSLVKFIMNDDEDIFVRRNASNELIKCIEGAKELVAVMVHTFEVMMNLPKGKNSTNKDFNIFSEVICDFAHELDQNYSVLLVNSMFKFLKPKSHDETRKSLEMGAVMLHALLENMSGSILPHLNYLINGLQIALEKSKYALTDRNEIYFGLCYHTLACVTILGQYISMTLPMLQPLRESLGTMLELLKYVAEYGTDEHYQEVAELLNILLKNRKFSTKDWPNVLKTCETIFQSDVYQDSARIRTLVIYGNYVALRRSYFASPKVFNSLLQNVINVICQEPRVKKEESQGSLPTPTSAAADLLQFISEKFPRHKFGATFVQIMSSIVKFRTMNEWQFRGVMISLGRVVKTCGAYLNANYSNELVLVFKHGFVNESRSVRDASTYALEKFFTHFLDESSVWTKLVFSSFLMHLTTFVSEVKSEVRQNNLHVERLFTTLGTFCDMLKAELSLYLPTLMKIYLDILQHIMQVRIIIVTIEMLTKALENCGAEFLKFFCPLILKLRPYLMRWDIADLDEVRPRIVELLRKIVLCALRNKYEIGIKGVTNLVFNMLKIQHARTQIDGPELSFILRYSSLRCSIFYYFREIPKLLHGRTKKYIPIIFGTLLCTTSAVRYLKADELQQTITYNKRPELLSTVEDLYSDSRDFKFRLSDNNELETARYRILQETYSLHNEVCEAITVLQDFLCPYTIKEYAEDIFLRFGPVLKFASPEIRKKMLFTLNLMMVSFLNDFPFVNSSFIDLCIDECVNLINTESDDFVVIGECVGSFLYYVSIKEKYIRPRIDVHIYLLGVMKDIFQVVAQLPQDKKHRLEKEFLLSQMISYMKEFADMCPPARFCNYFRLYLIIFEAKVSMPLFRSPNYDQLRTQAFQQLIFAFRIVKKFKIDCLYKIANMFLNALSDPVISTRECATAGLSLIVKQCHPEDIFLQKRILKVLQRRSRRERSMVVLEGIWYDIVIIITRNIWRISMQRLSLRTIPLLPVRDQLEYNWIILTFFETIWMQKPEYTFKVVKDIYKYLVEILKKNLETDVDPLYRRALTLAASLYATHVDELRKISMNPLITQAILSSCKNRVFQRAITS